MVTNELEGASHQGWEQERHLLMTDIDTITMSPAEYEALLDSLEDAEDALAVRNFHAVIPRRGIDAVRKDGLPAVLVWPMVDGEHPLVIWREHRGLSGAALARLSGVPQSYVSEIETRKKPGSIHAMRKLATAFGVTIDDLAPENST
jgi:DNA-binding XRE family transcriptional regulator